MIVPILYTKIDMVHPNTMTKKNYHFCAAYPGIRKLFYTDETGAHIIYSNNRGCEDWRLKHIFDELNCPWWPQKVIFDCFILDRDAFEAKSPREVLAAETIRKMTLPESKYKGDLIAVCIDAYFPEEPEMIFSKRRKKLEKLFHGKTTPQNIFLAESLGVGEIQNGTVHQNWAVKIADGEEPTLLYQAMDAPYIQGKNRELYICA